MMNILLALKALNTLLVTIGAAAEAASRIRVVINKARSEDRDISDGELAEIQAETDEIEESVLRKLRNNAIIR